MEMEWLFTQFLLGFAALSLAMRAKPALEILGRSLIARTRHMGEGDFYCFFPTRSVATARL